MRPTPDRVRETLFNWLAPTIQGARCLDLFAGSGALGLEALSRGAGEVVFIERDRQVAEQLRQNLSKLDDGNARFEVHQTDALAWLRQYPVSDFDIVMLDPPFQSDLLESVCEQLDSRDWLRTGGLIYLESASRQTLVLPPHWRLLRDKIAGQVAYRLAENSSTSS